MNFSERIGATSVRTVMQKNDMDAGLKNGLWDVLTDFYWCDIKRNVNKDNQILNINLLIDELWHNFFKFPSDQIPKYGVMILEEIRRNYNSYPWHKVYNFIEFIAENAKDNNKNKFMQSCNKVLERDMSAYRFINGILAPITAEVEIAEIEKAAQYSDKYSPVSTHINTAIQHLSNRESPDYRNSIKESISAVESVCKIISENDKATLGEGLKQIDTKFPGKMHPALKESFLKLYGYSSDEGGIRHSLLDESNVDFTDAKFMLVSCSAFTNYLISKFEG